MIYERPDLVFDATSCGGNCSKWILEIGRLKDITIQMIPEKRIQARLVVKVTE